MSTFCAYYDSARCRSCSWLERDYASQLAAKEGRVRSELGFLGPFALEPSAGSPERGFRDRAKMAVTGTAEAPVVGLLGDDGDLDAGRELLSCPIHHPWLNELIGALPALISDAGIEPYRIRDRRGELKGLIAFYSPASEQGYLRFVLRSRAAVPRVRGSLLAPLQRRFPGLVCVSANIQPVPHAILEGPEEEFVTERRSIEHRIGGLRLELSPRAFAQTNGLVATELYHDAARWIAEVRPARMLELFCGQGAFSLLAAPSAGEVLGVEINAEAVASARSTANEHGIANARFEALDATAPDATRALDAFGADLVLVNPPRRGLGRAVELVERLGPAHLLYSSCSIETLAADLRRLAASGYRLERARVFDLFPHTEHFETLAWLRRA